MLAVLVGFMMAAWLFTLVGVAYCLWRYAKKPFDAVARSIKDVHELIVQEVRAREELAANVKIELGLRKTPVLDDDAQLRAERRLQSATMWKGA